MTISLMYKCKKILKGECFMKKKLIALLCGMVMTVSLIACGSNDTKKSSEVSTTQSKTAEASKTESVSVEEPKEPVELVYWYCNGTGKQEYTQKVEDELNAYLAETEGYEHITIRLMPNDSQYATNFSLAQTSGEQIDLISTAGMTTSQLIADGSLMPLDDLIAGNSEITADLPDWFVELGKENGVTYYVPNYQQCANQYFWYTPTEYFEGCGYTVEEVEEILQSKDFDRIAAFYEEYILGVRELTGTETKYIDGTKISDPRLWIQPSQSLKTFTWTSLLYWDEEAQEVKFSDFNENIVAGFKKNAEWYEEGIIYENCLNTEGYYSTSVLLADASVVFFHDQNYGSNEMVGQTYAATRGHETTAINVHDSIYLPNTNAAGGVGISSTCEHPEEAAKVLALLFNSKYEYFYNTLCYGLEGVHYEKLSDEEVKTLEFDGTQGGAETTYCYHKWRGGNTFNAWRNQSMTAAQEEYIINEINESEDAVQSSLMGFTFDLSGVEDEIAQCTTVAKEYNESLMYGIMGANVDVYYQEYVDKMEAAGIQTILDELNAQAQAYLSSK